MSGFIAPVEMVLDWLRTLSRAEPVYLPRPLGKQSFRFQRLEDGEELALAPYRPSVVPPTKLLSPAREELLRFGRTGDAEVQIESLVDRSSRVVAGVRPCDLKAFVLQDRVQSDGVPDPHYLARRDSTAIVALACLEPCDERAFCAATGALDQRQGADVFLTPDGQELLLEALTARGEGLLARGQFRSCADLEARRQRALAQRPRPFGRQLRVACAELPALLARSTRSAVWDRHVQRCFSCGSCTLVCPTCYCFDVKDDLNLDLASGVRERTWDSCMLPEFAVVAGGHNFRPEPAARQRHRVKRKFEYLMQRFDLGSFCVGCGRCGRQCPTGIDIHEIVNDLVDGGSAA